MTMRLDHRPRRTRHRDEHDAGTRSLPLHSAARHDPDRRRRRRRASRPRRGDLRAHDVRGAVPHPRPAGARRRRRHAPPVVRRHPRRRPRRSLRRLDRRPGRRPERLARRRRRRALRPGLLRHATDDRHQRRRTRARRARRRQLRRARRPLGLRVGLHPRRLRRRHGRDRRPRRIARDPRRAPTGRGGDDPTDLGHARAPCHRQQRRRLRRARRDPGLAHLHLARSHRHPTGRPRQRHPDGAR